MDGAVAYEFSHLAERYGYWAVAGFIGLESIGLPLPGETALVAAAVYAGTTHNLNIGLVIMTAFASGVIGGSIGYWIGRHVGEPLVIRYGRYLHLTGRRIKLGRYLFWRHGGKVVFFGRFVALLRALASFLAGLNEMEWPRFFLFNASGSAVWATIYGLGAYLLGEEIVRFSEPAAIVLLLLVLIGCVAGFLFLRSHEKQLEDEAERVFPGPVDARI